MKVLPCLTKGHEVGKLEEVRAELYWQVQGLRVKSFCRHCGALFETYEKLSSPVTHYIQTLESQRLSLLVETRRLEQALQEAKKPKRRKNEERPSLKSRRPWLSEPGKP